MWVVKLGGSLWADPLLPQWLALLAQLGGGRVTVVSGGGPFSEEVRRVQAHWQFDDLAAHNMAVLAMVQSAYQLHALEPALQPATRERDIPNVLHKGKTALWMPFELQRKTPDPRTNWSATSDTIALDLACRLNAERLVLVKSCVVEGRASLSQLGQAGVVDWPLAALAEKAPFPIDVVDKNQLEHVRALLLGEVRFSA